MKNCRVDYKEINGFRYSLLVDYLNNDRHLYYTAGVKQIKDLYGDFKFSALNELPIDNYPLPFINISKLDGLKYQY